LDKKKKKRVGEKKKKTYRTPALETEHGPRKIPPGAKPEEGRGGRGRGGRADRLVMSEPPSNKLSNGKKKKTKPKT